MKTIDYKDLNQNFISRFLFVIVISYSAYIGYMISLKNNFFEEGDMLVYVLLFFKVLLIILISFFISILLHETGHLVFGKLSGYKFHSFQVLSIKLININNKLKFVKATNMILGQCIMKNDNNIEDTKYKLYLYGGSLFNLLSFILAFSLSLLLYELYGIISSFIIIFSWINLMLFYSNGIPLNNNGIYNDAMNMKLMNKYDFMKELVLKSLKLQMEIDEKESINDIDDSLLNTANDIDNEIIHKYPFSVARTIKRIVNHEENRFELMLAHHKTRFSLPLQYKYSNIIFVLYYYIINKISYIGILSDKTYKALFKNPKSFDSLLEVSLSMIDYLEHKKNIKETVDFITAKTNELENKNNTPIEKECYKILFSESIEYINEIERLRNEN